tara:strand:- start:1448 stop:1825 length:378 start_codon:yes stop_codon:yes gene_type:complete
MPHKKNHSWKDLAGEAGSTLKKGALHIKKKWQSDANPVQAIQNRKITQNIKKGTAAGKIQKTLTDAGHSKTGLRLQGEKNQAFKDNRKKMDAMRKNNPEKYKKLKKKQRKEEMAKSFKAKSSTWD